MRDTRGEKIFYAMNYVFLIAVALLCLAPLVYVFAVSFSANDAVKSGLVTFWPVKFTTVGYEYLLVNQMFWRSMLNSVVRVLLGTLINLTCTCLVAFPLSRSNARFKFRTVYAWFFFIPMLVGGGLIPSYMVVKETGIMNSIWALIIPGAVPVFYVMVLLNFFRNLPSELEEAALIDGAGQFRVLLQIYLPLSTPSLATIAVYAILGHWNDWFSGSIYLNQLSDFPLMTYLQTIVVNYDPNKLTPTELERMSKLGSETMEAAQIFVSMLPVLLSYPFFQRYFTKGLVLGGVKG